MGRGEWEEEGRGMEGTWEEVDLAANEAKEGKKEIEETREDCKQEEGEGEKEMEIKNGVMMEEEEAEGRGDKMEMKKGVMMEEEEGEGGEGEMKMKTGVLEGEEGKKGRVDSYYQTGR